ncbi:MAG: hypothetical protein J7L47_09140 [Candidatus Odinarchaeota archaeon]|nr:hypothetical protein [Candidatus Odinarchaeota archaeon]
MIGMKAFGITIIALTSPFWVFLLGAVLLQYAGGIELVRYVFEPALNADLFLITLYLMVVLKSVEALANFIIMLLNTQGFNLQYWDLSPIIDDIVALFRSFAGL